MENLLSGCYSTTYFEPIRYHMDIETSFLKLDEDFKHGLEIFNSCLTRLRSKRSIRLCRLWIDKLIHCLPHERLLRNIYLEQLCRHVHQQSLGPPFDCTPKAGLLRVIPERHMLKRGLVIGSQISEADTGSWEDVNESIIGSVDLTKMDGGSDNLLKKAISSTSTVKTTPFNYGSTSGSSCGRVQVLAKHRYLQECSEMKMKPKLLYDVFYEGAGCTNCCLVKREKTSKTSNPGVKIDPQMESGDNVRICHKTPLEGMLYNVINSKSSELMSLFTGANPLEIHPSPPDINLSRSNSNIKAKDIPKTRELDYRDIEKDFSLQENQCETISLKSKARKQAYSAASHMAQPYSSPTLGKRSTYTKLACKCSLGDWQLERKSAFSDVCSTTSGSNKRFKREKTPEIKGSVQRMVTENKSSEVVQIYHNFGRGNDMLTKQNSIQLKAKSEHLLFRRDQSLGKELSFDQGGTSVTDAQAQQLLWRKRKPENLPYEKQLPNERCQTEVELCHCHLKVQKVKQREIKLEDLNEGKKSTTCSKNDAVIKHEKLKTENVAPDCVGDNNNLKTKREHRCHKAQNSTCRIHNRLSAPLKIRCDKHEKETKSDKALDKNLGFHEISELNSHLNSSSVELYDKEKVLEVIPLTGFTTDDKNDTIHVMMDTLSMLMVSVDRSISKNDQLEQLLIRLGNELKRELSADSHSLQHLQRQWEIRQKNLENEYDKRIKTSQLQIVNSYEGTVTKLQKEVAKKNKDIAKLEKMLMEQCYQMKLEVESIKKEMEIMSGKSVLELTHKVNQYKSDINNLLQCNKGIVDFYERFVKR